VKSLEDHRRTKSVLFGRILYYGEKAGTQGKLERVREVAWKRRHTGNFGHELLR
jgi:hypothetical protein